VDCADFDSFAAAYKRDLREHIRQLTDQISANQERKARYQPQVVRSLLVDDCLENGREYNAGGARYNWSVVNVMGLANVVDSLAAVREVVYEKQEVTAEELLAILAADFAEQEPLRKRLERCPRFGNGDPRADDLAVEVSEWVFREFLRTAPWRGGRFVPACLMFTTYAYFGEPVGATPDGRHAGQPIADSAGAMQGRDRNGPTALIRSVTRIPHHLAPGTLVVNARFSQSFFRDGESRAKLKDLIRSYFRLGGMQIQINVVDQALLRDAIAHPERHEDLIIRVGGYSEYFNVLSDALKQSILERTEHE
jgi:formate C-acetyltransferase